MKKRLMMLMAGMLILLSACNLPFERPLELDDEGAAVVATSVALTLTASVAEPIETATLPQISEGEDDEIATFTPEPATPTTEPSATPTLTETATLEPTATLTPTPENEDPLSWLGDATWRGTFDGGSDEGFYTVSDEHTTFTMENNALVMTSSLAVPGWHTWSMTYRTIEDFYLEADINVKNCSGVDEYGIIFRGPDYSSGYFFAARCNGEYSLRGYDGSYTNIIPWQFSDALNRGAYQTNRLGVMVKDNSIALYINGRLVKEVDNDQFEGAGHFGVFIAAFETAGFSIEIDRIRYWLQN
jgi:hypothetical protein